MNIIRIYYNQKSRESDISKTNPETCYSHWRYFKFHSFPPSEFPDNTRNKIQSYYSEDKRGMKCVFCSTVWNEVKCIHKYWNLSSSCLQ
jgi:hypothetical protein